MTTEQTTQDAARMAECGHELWSECGNCGHKSNGRLETCPKCRSNVDALAIMIGDDYEFDHRCQPTSSPALALAPGHVSIPRAVLERLTKAAASDASAREARWAAERILQQAALATEPARTDPEAARGEARRTASTNLHTAGAALVLQDIARSCAALTSDDAPARLELAPTALDLLRALGAVITTSTLYEAGKRPQETTTARLTVDALEIVARQSHDAEGPIVEPEPPPAILPHILAALRRVRDALPTGDSGKHALTQALSQLEGARDMLAIGRVHAAIDILSDIEPKEESAS